ncbi:unnamed protein product, partial [Porites evermanni]
MDANLEKLLQNDETFRQFLEDEFDDRTYANNIIQGRAISDALARLADGINLLDKELHSQVVEHHEDLLQQATGIETLEGVLQMMQTRINSLKASVERIQQHIAEPYFKIVSRTAQLRRLQEACDILRRVIRVIYLTKRLQSHLQGGAREITKAAQNLSELDYLVQGADLSGIQAVENDLKIAAKARKDVENQAQRMLAQGMETQNQTQVGTALQVFYNLGLLVSTVNEVVRKVKEKLASCVQEALDSNTLSQAAHSSAGGPGRAAMPAPGNTAAWRATLWTRMEQLMDSIFSACGQVNMYMFIRIVCAEAEKSVLHVQSCHNFARAARCLVVLLIKPVASQVAQARNMSIGEHRHCCLKVCNCLYLSPNSDHHQYYFLQTSPRKKGTLTCSLLKLIVTFWYFYLSPEQALKKSLAPFETAYLSRSLSRLFDPINLVFPSGARNPPSKEELTSIAKTIGSELSVASVDAGLTITVARNVAKTVQLYSAKCEQLVRRLIMINI